MRDPFFLRMSPEDAANFRAACERAAQREISAQPSSVTPTGQPAGKETPLDDNYPGLFLPPWSQPPAIADGVEYDKPQRPGQVNRDEPGWRRIGRART